MRSPSAIKSQIDTLADELKKSENHWHREQYREICLDELDACQSLDDVKRFLASSLVDLMVEDYGKKIP